MRIVTGLESQEIDRVSQGLREDDYYMENVARKISDWIRENFSSGQKIVFICGPGNNGGDGLCCARHLLESGYTQVKIFFSSPQSSLAKKKLTELQNSTSLFPIENQSVETLSLEWLNADLLVDGVFGVGLQRRVENPWAAIFEAINHSRVPVLAIDLPSGLGATEGNIFGFAVRARWTFCVRPFKTGVFLNAGPSCCGEIIGVDAGFPQDIIQRIARSQRLIGAESCKKIRPHRRWSSNKTHFGHLAVVGGSEGMQGAAILAGLGALRSGVGYVTLVSNSADKAWAHPEFLRAREKGINFSKYKAFVFGPGLKPNHQHLQLLKELKARGIPVVLDAGILDFLKAEKFFPVPPNWILTPHAGELSRLIDIPAAQIESERVRMAELAQKELGGILVLKGFHTLVRSESRNYIVDSGNPALAKAGTGDVLAGMIGSFLAQKLSPVKAAVLAVYLHGAAADLWIREGHTVDSLLPTDLLERVSRI